MPIGTSPSSPFCLQATVSDSIIFNAPHGEKTEPLLTHATSSNLIFNLFIFEKDRSPLQFDIAMDREMRTAM